MKRNSDSEIGDQVKHFAGSIELPASGVDSHLDGCPFRQGVSHFNVATVKAESAHTGCDLGPDSVSNTSAVATKGYRRVRRRSCSIHFTWREIGPRQSPADGNRGATARGAKCLTSAISSRNRQAL